MSFTPAQKRAWYKSHRKQHLNDRRVYRQALNLLVRAAKAKPCMDCGVQYPYYVMDLDHRDASTKVASVSDMVSRSSVQTLLDEIQKCDVVCSNCHRIRTHKRRSN